jgi:hypothetical protein
MNLHGQDASVFLELGKLLDPWLIDAHPSSEGKTVHARLETVGEAPICLSFPKLSGCEEVVRATLTVSPCKTETLRGGLRLYEP